jgi:uncharacterized protein YegP (UPF0339 family)
MTGWFELHKSSDGQYRFLLKADGGHTLLTSELYRAKDSAEGGLTSVRTNSALDARFEKKVASNGKVYFNLQAANHQVIGTSPIYASDQARDAAIAEVKACAAGATVKDST